MIHYGEWDKNGLFVTSVTQLSPQETSPTSSVDPITTSSAVKNASTNSKEPKRLKRMSLSQSPLSYWTEGYQCATRSAKSIVSDAMMEVKDPDSKTILESVWQKINNLEKTAHLEAPTIVD